MKLTPTRQGLRTVWLANNVDVAKVGTHLRGAGVALQSLPLNELFVDELPITSPRQFARLVELVGAKLLAQVVVAEASEAVGKESRVS